jgi:serine protease
VTVEMAIAAYSKQSGVAYAQPNYVFKVAETPSDPDFAELWGLNNTGQSGGVADADIDAPEAWETATGSSDVVVAVVDTGVDYTHPDLEANMWKNPGEIAGNGIDDDKNGFVDDVYGIDTANDDSDPMDDNGHGTHCSGTIGAVGDNGIGVAGVSWHVKIMALKFLSSSGYGTTEDAIDAIEYGAAMGADIFSNSWGGGAFDQALYDTIAGIDKVFCFAAGNSSEDTDYFANYPSCFDLPNIIAVGASTRTEEAAGFSNYGQTTVDLFAPGDEILSTVPGGYAVYGGTSMATPHVAGTAALLLSQNPTASWESLKLALMGSAESKAAYAGKCLTGARLNAAYALESAGAATGSVSGIVSCTGVPVEGVDVAVDSTLLAMTDADGRYTITGVSPGTHSVVAAGDGYLTEVVAGVVVLSGQPAVADVHVSLAGQISGAVTAVTGGSLLEDITVTA